MGTAALFFALMSALTKAATSTSTALHPLPGSLLAFYRYTGSLMVMIALRQLFGVPLLGENRVGLLWRGVSGGIAATCYFISIQYTSLTHAVLLNYTSVLWGPLFAIFALREKLPLRYLVMIPVGLLGVAFITRPELGTIHIGDGIALLSGLVSGSAIVQIRRLRKTEAATSIFFYFNLIGVPICLLVLALTRTPLSLPTLIQLPYVVGIVFCSITGQLLMTYGYRELSTAEGGLLSMTTNLYSPLFALLFFHEVFHWTTLLGGTLILLSAGALIAIPTKKTS
jgi:drug/metabolite transporter (DMT)-like permease